MVKNKVKDVQKVSVVHEQIDFEKSNVDGISGHIKSEQDFCYENVDSDDIVEERFAVDISVNTLVSRLIEIISNVVDMVLISFVLVAYMNLV